MSEKINLFLLIICGILFQFVATSSDNDIIAEESPDLLVREKRVVDLDQQGHASTPIEQANYMVLIKGGNLMKVSCVGVILSHYTVITAALCVMLPANMYQVVSGTGYVHSGSNHTVSSKLTNSGTPPHTHFDGIALLTVEPHFIFGPKTGSINLYTRPLQAGTEATVFGWGCSYPLLPATGLQRRLRKIRVPIMDHTECENVYRRHFLISYKHICTYHERKYCARTDQGAPLVVDNMLAGIHVIKPEIVGQTNPDVFVDLQLPEYNTWITQNTRFI